jgi:hypothetical protein
MNAAFPKHVDAERLENVRSLLRESENELSRIRHEYEVTFVQYLRSVFNPEANCRLRP